MLAISSLNTSWAFWRGGDQRPIDLLNVRKRKPEPKPGFLVGTRRGLFHHWGYQRGNPTHSGPAIGTLLAVGLYL